MKALNSFFEKKTTNSQVSLCSTEFTQNICDLVAIILRQYHIYIGGTLFSEIKNKNLFKNNYKIKSSKNNFANSNFISSYCP